MKENPDLARECRNELMMAQLLVAISYQIRAMRQTRGWSYVRLAKKSGLTERRVADLEAGTGLMTNNDLNDLKKIASAFDVALIARFTTSQEFSASMPTTIEKLNLPRLSRDPGLRRGK